MDLVPPSYDAATARNPWGLIAPYIPSAQLCALNRVNNELHNVFAPCLWGNPASHFGTENDRVYVALTRFRRTLKRVRLSVRELTHTLHLPPAQSELYDGPHPEWLRDVLEQLPNLQSLIVSRLPFFDHMALLALRNHSNGRRSSLGSDLPPTFTLRLLIASQCQNTTSQGLAEALEHFPLLAYLDLSRTSAARDRGVLAKLGALQLLQVLKLRDIHLRDDGVACLADSIGIRVRSLDVSENDLTDNSVRSLLGSCFVPREGNENGSGNAGHGNASTMPVEDWPAGFVRPDPAALDEFQDESYDERFVRRLTSKVMSRLPFEDLPQSGITHLYISGNRLSVEGLAALIRSERLHVLDAGSINTRKAINPPLSKSSTVHHLNIPGLEKLIPVLIRCGQGISSLRVDISLISRKAPPIEEHPPLAVSELAAERQHQPREMEAAASQIAELDNTQPPTYELDSLEVAPAYELPATPADAPSTHIVQQAQLPVLEDQSAETRRGSAFAPEVAQHQDEFASDNKQSPVLTATGLTQIAQTANGVSRSASSPAEPTTTGSSNLPEKVPVLSLASIEMQRKDLHAKQSASGFGLMPCMLPGLRSMTLTGVPSYEPPHRTTVNALITFIKFCAAEAQLALDEARLRSQSVFHTSSVVASPRQAHHHHRQTTREIFPLQKIVLEVEPGPSPRPGNPSSSDNIGTSLLPQTSRTKSSTEDPDSEAFWTASENDFTFFDDEDGGEECGLPASEKSPFADASASALPPDKVIVSAEESATQGASRPPVQGADDRTNGGAIMTDVVAELAAFRKERKTAFDDAATAAATRGIGIQERQGAGVGVKGYWPGEVKVVRVAPHHHRPHHRHPQMKSWVGGAGGGGGGEGEGEVDYYGNWFEKRGGVYR